MSRAITWDGWIADCMAGDIHPDQTWQDGHVPDTVGDVISDVHKHAQSARLAGFPKFRKVSITITVYDGAETDAQ